jgi:energy-coupling factor transporter ATP-binding protein EcfA2
MFDLISVGNEQQIIARLKEIGALSSPKKREQLTQKKDGKTLLHAAISQSGFNVIRTIIEMLAEIKANVNEPDEQNSSPLHLAIELGKIDVVRELVANDANLELKNQAKKTPLDIAVEKAKQGNADTYLSIASLLRTREEWAKVAVQLKFNRVVGLIEKCFPAINPGRGTDKLLCIGGTGAGKSTLLNYLNGTRYRIKVDLKSSAEVRGGNPEIARVGHGMISQTLYPQVIVKPNLNFTYCDLAGLADSRGHEERICAASSVQVLTRLPGNIKGIMLVLDVPGFLSEKGAGFKSTAAALSRIVQSNPKLMNNVQFVITKAPVGTTNEAILKTFVNPLLDSLIGDLNSDETAVKFMLEQMVLHKRNIIIPNIADDGESALELERRFNLLQTTDPKLYSFVKHDGAQKSFNDSLQAIAEGYLKRQKAIKQGIPADIQNQINLQAAKNTRIAEIEREIADRRQQIGQQYDPASLDSSINQKKKKITANEGTIKNKGAAITTRTTQIGENDGIIKSLDTNEMVFVEKLTYDIHGRPREHNLRYESLYPCYGPSSVGGFFRGYGHLWDELLPECNGDAGLYSSMLHASDGLTKVDVEFNTHRKYKEKAKIDDCRTENTALIKLNFEDQRDVDRLTQENKQLNAEILACESEKIQGAANMQIRKDRLQNEVNIREQWLTSAKQELAESIAEQRKLEAQKLATEREISVNAGLFSIIYRVSKILDLGSNENIKKFWQEYEINNPNAKMEYEAWSQQRASDGPVAELPASRLSFSTALTPSVSLTAAVSTQKVVTSDAKQNTRIGIS